MQNFFFAIVHTLATHEKRSHLDEQQIEKLISMSITVFIGRNLYDIAFVNSDGTFLGLTALLIQIALNHCKVFSCKLCIDCNSNCDINIEIEIKNHREKESGVGGISLACLCT